VAAASTNKPQQRTEAEFLSVVPGSLMTVIADVLPALPSQSFSSFEKITAKPAASGDYYLEEDEGAPQSLLNIGAFFTRVWLHGVVNDLYLDLLEADELDMPAFTSTAGDIAVEAETNLGGLPAAGFRRAVNDTITVYTCFAFADNGHALHRSLVVHDLVVHGTKKEEMVQVFTPTAEASLVHVQYYAYNGGKKLGNGSKAEAFLVTVKDVVLEAGGVYEVDGEDARQRLADVEEAKAAAQAHEDEETKDDDDLRDSDDTRFNTKAPDKTNIFQKAFKMSKKVVAAPLTLGVAAGSAVLDGASGVVKTQTDSLFRKHFPHRAHEELIDSFSCAYSNGPIVKQGYLYCTATCLCFKGTVLEAKLEVQLEDISEFRKANTAMVFPTAIEVLTLNGEKYVFSSFIARDDALKTMHKLWMDSDELR
jgi:hypothetical protein